MRLFSLWKLFYTWNRGLLSILDRENPRFTLIDGVPTADVCNLSLMFCV